MGESGGLLRGVYTAERASALSGVPISTLHYWDRNRILRPSLSVDRPKRWTYADLLGVRAIYWLRKKKGPASARTPMNQVRALMRSLEESGQRLGDPELRVWVDTRGEVSFETPQGVHWRPTKAAPQGLFPETIDLLAEFRTDEGLVGPDLRKPREHLRIIPGKLSGEPHVHGSRITSQAIAALFFDGYNREQIIALYPKLSAAEVDECWDLERQLSRRTAA
jgi:uncharacterized protein (DUF433 family)